MITKRLLRFALGPSFLTLDSEPESGSDDVVPLTPYKQRLEALYQVQNNLLSSLGIYAGKAYRIPVKREAPIRSNDEVLAEMIAIEKAHTDLEPHRSRYLILLGTFFFLSSITGTIIYDLKAQVMTLDNSPISILGALKSVTGSSFLMSFASSYGMMMITETIESALTNVFQAYWGDDVVIGTFVAPFVKELIVYPFRELSLAHSLRLVSPFTFMPSYTSFHCYSPLLNIPKYLIHGNFKRLESLTRGAYNYIWSPSRTNVFEDAENDEYPFLLPEDFDATGSPTSINLAAHSVYTYCRTNTADLMISLWLISIDPIVFRIMAKDFIAARPGLIVPSILPALWPISVGRASALAAIIAADWAIQYGFFELLGAASWCLEEYHNLL